MEIKREPTDLLFENVNINKCPVHIVPYNTIKPEQAEFTSQSFTNIKVENVDILDFTPPETNISEVRAEDFYVNINDLHKIKHEVADQPKYEQLNEEWDIPSLKTETDPLGFSNQPCSSKQSQDGLHLIKKLTAKKRIKKNRKYFCPVCLKDFTSTKGRKKHLSLHFKRNLAICLFCGKIFTKKVYFLHHFSIHLNKTKWKAKYLTKIPDTLLFTSNSLTDKPFKCNLCSSSFKLKYSLKYHILFKHLGRKPYTCNYCKKRFCHKSYLKGHIRTHTGEKPFVCNLCSKAFAKAQYLKYHLKTHSKERRFECDICKKRFSQKVSLIHHIRIHTGEKPFACDVCSKAFSRKLELRRHSLVHTGLQPYKCEICLRAFKKRDNLKLHILNHTGEKPFRCDICLKEFKGKHNLKIHMRVHTGERPFRCEICSKAFKIKPTLNQHLKTHYQDVRPFTCEICSRGFTRRGGLTSHYRTHTQEKRYKCEICCIGYAAKITLRKHNALVHPELVNVESVTVKDEFDYSNNVVANDYGFGGNEMETNQNDVFENVIYENEFNYSFEDEKPRDVTIKTEISL